VSLRTHSVVPRVGQEELQAGEQVRTRAEEPIDLGEELVIFPTEELSGLRIPSVVRSSVVRLTVVRPLVVHPAEEQEVLQVVGQEKVPLEEEQKLRQEVEPWVLREVGPCFQVGE